MPRGRRVGILSSAFNPPTLAHLELARQAMRQHALDGALFFLPLVFPHKTYVGASLQQRIEMLVAALAEEPRFSIASSEDGLFIEIARACRAVYGGAAELFFVCGRDAAERIVGWDYGEGPSIGEQLREFQLLVAARGERHDPPAGLRDRIHALELAAEFQAQSSSAVREAVGAGRPWEHLVPAAVAEIIRRDGLYRSGPVLP